MSEEKTKEPTEKRLRDARKDGEVAKSTDLTNAVTFLSTLTLLLFAQRLLKNHVQTMLQVALNFVSSTHTIEDLLAAIQSIGSAGLTIIFLTVLVSMMAAVAILLSQVGFGVSFKPVELKLDAINPAQGFQRIFSLKAMGELVRSIIKSLFIGAVIYKAIVLLFPLIANSAMQPLDTILQVSWSILLKLFFIVGLLFFIIGLADYKFQKWIFIRQHRMSDTEIKQEHKEMEGDPHVKDTRRKLAREIAFSPSLKKAIATSNVMVTNPTHYAVAIRYVPKEFALPRIVAKGSDELAATMRQLAGEIGIPIVSNPHVARALFKVPLQQAVPEELFEVIAAILRWVEGVGAKQQQPAAQ